MMYAKSMRQMELCIKTLTGVSLDILVSPFDTIYDIKYRIQKHEGIPISQQHLIWQSEELEDTRSLRDYRIQNGSTLQLVLSMRGGPVNTRRACVDTIVPVAEEPPTLNEMAEYFLDSSRDSASPSSAHRLPMLIVYHSGDQLNLYRVIDREETSSLSYSFGGSVDNCSRNSPPVPRERCEENDRTREKMNQIKSQMRNLNLVKEQKEKAARRPRTGRLLSSRAVSRIRRYSPLEEMATPVLNKHRLLPPIETLQDCLPDLRQSSGELSRLSIDLNAGKMKETSFDVSITGIRPNSGRVITSNASNTANVSILPSTSSEVIGMHTGPSIATTDTNHVGTSSFNDGARVTSNPECVPTRMLSIVGDRVVTSSAHLMTHDTDIHGVKWRTPETSPEQALASASSTTLGSISPLSLLGRRHDTTSIIQRPGSTTGNRVSGTLPELSLANGNGDPSAAVAIAVSSVMGLSSNPTRSSVKIQSLNAHEVRAMSGMLNSIVRSQTRMSSLNSTTGMDAIGGLAPSTRIKSSRRKCPVVYDESSSFNSAASAHRPSNKPAVRSSSSKKRCAVCGKRTRLAMSFQCRCGDNFCALHRYAESHACTFDYRAEGRKLLEQNNPVVTAPKLPKI